jgi:carbamoyltransferase
MNGRILRETPFERLFVQPAANDAGTSLGAAVAVHTLKLGRPRAHRFDTVYLGPSASDGSIDRAAEAAGLRPRAVDDVVGESARLLAEGKILGWFHGRMEVGPRALGNRSILADPRRAEMKDVLNHKIKKREGFRPFAPVVLQERAADYFIGGDDSPFMLVVAPVRPERRDEIPAVVHVDGTGRVQTVTRSQNPEYYEVVWAFDRLTGVPVLLNTSFNERGQPIVDTPEEAIRTFLSSGMDHLVMDGRLFDRPESSDG